MKRGFKVKKKHFSLFSKGLRPESALLKNQRAAFIQIKRLRKK